MHWLAKVAIALVVLALAAFAIAFGVSRYLVDKLDGSGAPAPAPAQSGIIEYRSEALGIAFSYPDKYRLETQGSALVLLRKDYVPPVDGEGPPARSVQVFDNPQGLSLEQWIKTDPRSNYQLSDGALYPSTALDDRPTLNYRHSGLYEYSVYAAAANGKIYLVSNPWPDDRSDPSTADIYMIINSFRFI